jgi:hypothetical protein
MEQKENDREPNQQNKMGSSSTDGSLDQRWQSVYGDQINVAGNVLGDVILSRLNPNDIRNQRNHAMLRQRVRSFWIDGVLRHSLYSEVLIQHNLKDRSDLVDNRPWNLILQRPDMADEALPMGMPIIDLFDRMGQRLLIVGEPGSGKTTILIELANALLSRAEIESTYPTPVVFNLASWTGEYRSLAEWLVTELQEKYNIPSQIAQVWLEKAELLPLLDGLDEVQAIHRQTCAAAINLFQQQHLTPLSICCRITEYEKLARQLKLQGAVLLQPLMDLQVDTYLRQIGRVMDPIPMLTQQDNDLYQLLRSPLMLNIMILAYQTSDIQTLSLLNNGSSAQHHLFNAYIQRMFVHRGMNHLYSPKRTIDWLRWLSVQLIKNHQTIFLIEYMQPHWLLPTQHLIFRCMLVLFFVTTICSTIWLVRLGEGAITTVINGALAGVLLGMMAIHPIEILGWSWQRARNGVIDGFFDGLKPGVAIGLLFGIVPVMTGNLAIGLLIWFCTSLFLGLIKGVIHGLLAALHYRVSPQTTVPNQGIRKSIRNALIVWITSTIFIAPLLILTNQFLLGLLDAILIGAVVGLVYGGQAFIAHWLLRFMLIISGFIPANYVHFLDYAAARIFLHRVGGGYIFIHRLLMEHFAILTDDDVKRIVKGLKDK